MTRDEAAYKLAVFGAAKWGKVNPGSFPMCGHGHYCCSMTGAENGPCSIEAQVLLETVPEVDPADVDAVCMEVWAYNHPEERDSKGL